MDAFFLSHENVLGCIFMYLSVLLLNICGISDLDICKSVFDWLASWQESSWSFHTVGYLDDAHW